MDWAIETTGLVKDYGALRAVDDVSLRVPQGQILSLLGPNGAGKTTTISIICGLVPPTHGEARIMGHSVAAQPLEAKAQIGLVPQDVAIYPQLSAKENLLFWGRMYGLAGQPLRQRVDEVLELIGLADRASGRAAKYSGGMKRRLNIGIALLHRPAVVIMDEPTVGIDPQSRRSILDGVKALNQQGMTVLYTTHYMEEAQELSHRIAIMDQGKLIAEGSHQELVQIVGELHRIRLTVTQAPETILAAWRELPVVRSLSAADGTIDMLVTDSNHALPLLFECAGKQGVRIAGVDIQEPNLETVFLHLTGRALRDEVQS